MTPTLPQIFTYSNSINSINFRSPVNSPHKGQWRGALMFFWPASEKNDWVNNREAGDLRHQRTHCSFWRHCTVYPKKYAHGFCFAVLCCGYTLTGFPISIRLTSLALWQSNDCPSASKATLVNMDKYFMWIHYERLHNHNKAKHNKTVCIFLGIYCNVVTVDGQRVLCIQYIPRNMHTVLLCFAFVVVM